VNEKKDNLNINKISENTKTNVDQISNLLNPQLNEQPQNIVNINNTNNYNNSQSNQQEAANKVSVSTSFNLTSARCIEFKSHFDVIRKLGYLENLNALVSISEDCLVKVWSLKNINYTNPGEIEPYLILRGHTGPLFSLALGPDDSNIIYTAGNEGVIKIWKILRQDETSIYGDTDQIFNCNIGFYQKSSEVIWDLKHHPKSVNIIKILIFN
jgi:WD40 repeat protein